MQMLVHVSWIVTKPSRGASLFPHEFHEEPLGTSRKPLGIFPACNLHLLPFNPFTNHALSDTPAQHPVMS